MTRAAIGAIDKLSSIGIGNNSVKVAAKAPTKITIKFKSISVFNKIKPTKRQLMKKAELPRIDLLFQNLAFPHRLPTISAMASPITQKNKLIITIGFSKKNTTSRLDNNKVVVPVTVVLSFSFRKEPKCR